MNEQPQKEHRWLERLVGDWTFEGEAPGEEGKESPKWTGTENVRSLGGLWILAEGKGEMPGGGEMTTIMTIGFDPKTSRYVGTFIGSMMSHLWLYNGALDDAEKILTLDSEGPSMSGDGKITKYQDIIEFKSDDHRVLSSRMLAEDGTWQHVMTANYRRKK